MRLSSKVMIAAVALATPILVAAQAPPQPGFDPGGQGPGMGMQQRRGPGMGQQMGPGMGMQQRMGPGRGMAMRGQRGMKMRQRFLRRHPGMVMNRLLQDPAVRERLKMTPEQHAKIQAHHSAVAKGGIRSRADLQVRHMELAELMRAEKPDRILIDKKLRELSDAQFAARKAAIDNQLTGRELLTAEQKQEMEKMRSEFRGRRMQGGQGGPGGMGPRGPRPMGPPPGNPPQAPPPDNGL